MKESILLEAISMYEDKGADAIEEINRTTAIYEYSLKVEELRIAEKIFKTLKYGENVSGKSPEEILIDKEEKERIFHFACWVMDYLKTQNPNYWELFRDRFILGISIERMAKKYNKSKSVMYKTTKRVITEVNSVIKLYDEEYGSLKDYLEM